MATTRFQSGGAFQPGEPVNLTGNASNFVNAPTIGGTATVAGTSTVVGSTDTQTLTNKTLTTPAILMTTAAVTSAGTTGTDGTALTAVTPAFISITGASGAGVSIPTGAALAGASYDLRNINVTGVQNVYAVGGSINGTTGTTAFGLSPTGSKSARLVCVVAGAWLVTAVSTT